LIARCTVEVLDFRHERRKPRRLRAAATHADRDICFPFTVYEIGALLGTSVRRVSQSSLPVWSSYARKYR
jgi:hypothetical protein